MWRTSPILLAYPLLSLSHLPSPIFPFEGSSARARIAIAAEAVLPLLAPALVVPFPLLAVWLQRACGNLEA